MWITSRIDPYLTTARARFPKTRWTLVYECCNGSDDSSQRARTEMCKLYWYPLYAYARRCGNEHPEAEDMTQGFFMNLLSKRYLDAVEESKGKLRTFLLVAMKNYMAKQWRQDRAQTRRPRHGFIYRDQIAAEERYRFEPVEDLTPDLVYERHWATTLLKRVGDRLRDEYIANGKGDLYLALSGFLSVHKPDQPYAEVASRFGMTTNAVAVTASRMRDRFRELLRQEVADTVSSREEVEEELRHLLQVLS